MRTDVTVDMWATQEHLGNPFKSEHYEENLFCVLIFVKSLTLVGAKYKKRSVMLTMLSREPNLNVLGVKCVRHQMKSYRNRNPSII